MDSKLIQELMNTKSLLEFDKMVLQARIPLDVWQNDVGVMEHFHYLKSIRPDHMKNPKNGIDPYKKKDK